MDIFGDIRGAAPVGGIFEASHFKGALDTLARPYRGQDGPS